MITRNLWSKLNSKKTLSANEQISRTITAKVFVLMLFRILRGKLIQTWGVEIRIPFTNCCTWSRKYKIEKTCPIEAIYFHMDLLTLLTFTPNWQHKTMLFWMHFRSVFWRLKLKLGVAFISTSHTLGDSRLIPWMADFSQGIFLQSVGRVKKKKKKKRAIGYKHTQN